MHVKAGDEVIVDGQKGLVVSVRMAPPDYRTVEAVTLAMPGRKNTAVYMIHKVRVAPGPEPRHMSSRDGYGAFDIGDYGE